MTFKTKVTTSLLAVFAASALLAFARPTEDSAAEKKNLAMNKKFYQEVFNKGNVAIIDELLADHFVEHEEMPGLAKGKEGVKQFFSMFRNAFPDLQANVEMMFAKDDKVVTYFVMTGTHKGEFMGMAATGKSISIKGIDIIRFENGKAVEHWGLTDSAAMMQQLGMMEMEEEHEDHGNGNH
ncbi:MAG: ester cyclase [Deferribacteres bacterium]|nr:ester cyclase [Deferribacteres bacterium]